MAGTEIHQTAIVDPGAELGVNVTVGPNSIIEANVQIGDGCQIASNVLIASGARLGKNVKVHHSAVVGTTPQDLKFGGEETTAEVGDNTVIREFVTINRGTKNRWKTVVGSDCLLMAYAHVSHDTVLGDHVIMANAVNLGGHVVIGDWAIVGGVVAVLQFTRIGKHAMIGGGLRVTQDVCPYSLIGGYPIRVAGVNRVGLQRRGFSEDTIKSLRKAFRIIFSSKLNTSQAFARIEDEMEIIPEVAELIEFIKSSKQGVIK